MVGTSVRPVAAGTVGEVMLRTPTTLPAEAPVAAVAAWLAGPHRHLALLTAGGRLVGTVATDDLVGADPGDLALRRAVLAGRTVGPDASAEETRRAMLEESRRRLVVVGPDGELLGLLCLKHHGRDFCTDDDVHEHRSAGPRPDRHGH
jgi:CBS domain-containing protein